MPDRCSIPECRAISNKLNGKISMFRLPRDATLRSKWLKSIGKKDWNPSEKAVICEKHFEPSCIVKTPLQNDKDSYRPKIVMGSLPTILVPPGTPLAVLERSKKVRKRVKKKLAMEGRKKKGRKRKKAVDLAFLICSHQIEVVTDAQVTSNSSLSETDAMTKYRCIEFLPPVHQELHPVVVPVSFSALPLYIDELVEPFRKGYSDFNVAKMCLKKVMLFLAEAKVCCAQRALLKLPDEPLPQKNLYLRKELEDLSSSFKQLPSPLAIYLDCIGNTNEGNFTVTPVLAEMQGIPTGHAGAISCGPRQLYPLLRSLNDGVKDEGYVELVKSISRSLPEIRWVENHHPSNCYLSDSLFSDKSKQTIRLTEEEIKQCQKLLNKLGIRYNMVSVNLLEGKGTMAQTVQTPDWDITDPFPYFCMSDLSVTDQKLGAIFGFSYTLGKEVQKSRYSGCPATAHWRGEVEPRLMLESIFESE